MTTDSTGMPAAPVHRSARQRAREQITAELLAAARRQLAAEGAAGLSLRSVARELGMVSSAVYRYFDSRDALLTRLIVDAYDALGATAEAAAEAPDSTAEAAAEAPDSTAEAAAEAPDSTAEAAGPSDLDLWVATARAIRAWALDHPHEYALLYGSPVPGYAAPEATTASGTRPSLALVGIVARAAAAGRLAPPSPADAPPLPAALAADLEGLARQVAAPHVPPEVTVTLIGAWTQLFGLVSFELFGQTRNMVVDNAALFDATVTRQALAIGLR